MSSLMPGTKANALPFRPPQNHIHNKNSYRDLARFRDLTFEPKASRIVRTHDVAILLETVNLACIDQQNQ